MKVQIKTALSDDQVDANQSNNQRQLCLTLRAVHDSVDQGLPLNLCLVIDHSGSMTGKPLETVKQAAIKLVDSLSPQDSLSVIAFDHRAKVIVPSQKVSDKDYIKTQIETLEADGGTCIDEGMKLAIKEAAIAKENHVSHIFILTDGENEHGDNNRCLKMAEVASDYSITLNTLGFGTYWNQDILEKIADLAGGTLCYIEKPEQASTTFNRLLKRMQAVGLTNIHLWLEFMPQVRLAELKPIAQVEPETVELTAQLSENQAKVRLGDLMTNQSRVILINLYLHQLPVGTHPIVNLKVSYDDPAQSQTELFSETIPVSIHVDSAYQPHLNPNVQQSILSLAKYRQTQIAEQKLAQGDTVGAATMLQTAAKTALQLGDQQGATVLQTSATQLQTGENLSETQRKKTRIVSKTILQDDNV